MISLPAREESPGLSLNRSHMATQGWSYGMPKPPQMTVVALPHDLNGFHTLPLSSGTLYEPQSTGLQSVDFIRSIDYGDYKSNARFSEWKYENRRRAQPILPFLYLGPTNVTRDLAFLRDAGITLMLCIRNSSMAHISGPAPKAAAALGIALHEIQLQSKSELIKAFPTAIDVINAHMTEQSRDHLRDKVEVKPPSTPTLPGKILVTCETGNAESALLVAAYIMAVHSKDWEHAAQIVQTQRVCSNFANAEYQLLSTFDGMLQAQRQVSQVSNRSVMLAPTHVVQRVSSHSHMRKRQLRMNDEDDGISHGGDGNMDQTRFDNRATMEPFLDSAGTP